MGPENLFTDFCDLPLMILMTQIEKVVFCHSRLDRESRFSLSLLMIHYYDRIYNKKEIRKPGFLFSQERQESKFRKLKILKPRLWLKMHRWRAGCEHKGFALPDCPAFTNNNNRRNYPQMLKNIKTKNQIYFCLGLIEAQITY